MTNIIYSKNFKIQTEEKSIYIEKIREKYVYILKNEEDAGNVSEEIRKEKILASDKYRFHKYVIDNLVNRYKLSIKRIDIIVKKLKFTEEINKYLLSKIVKSPTDFINYDEQLLRIENVERINSVEKLNIKATKRIECYIIDKFLKDGQPKMYIEKWRLDNDVDMWVGENIKNKDIPKTIKKLKKILILKKFKNKEYYTTAKFLNIEYELGDILIDNYNNVKKKNYNYVKVKEFIINYEKKNNMLLTLEQREAVQHCLRDKLSIITGYPGTGKTTIMNVVGEYMSEVLKNKNIMIMAPTGLAVKNLMERCSFMKNKKEKIGTIHKILYSPNKDMDNEIDHIIIDESSMIDLFLFKKLLKLCIDSNCSVTLVGDKNQLPPIGCGRPFEGIINSNIFEYVNLTKIKRQSGKLKDVIININEGKGDVKDFDNKSIKLINEEDINDNNLRKHLKEIIKDYGKDNVHIITPQHKYEGGTENVNKEMQNMISNTKTNKEIARYFDKIFVVGDKVVRTENDYSDGDGKIRVNGDVGIIEEDITNRKKVKVVYDKNDSETLTQLEFVNNFEHFYGSTVHKMQGSQKDVIVLILSKKHSMWKGKGSKKLLYTAISRAKKHCIIIGTDEIFNNANKEEEDYITMFMKNDYWSFIDD